MDPCGPTVFHHVPCGRGGGRVEGETLSGEGLGQLIIDAFKIGTDDELADLLTKAIAREDEKYKRFRNDIMNIE